MGYLDYIDPFYFLVGLAVGLLYTYLTAPKPQIIFKYPTPDNAGNVTYVDDAGVCYRYKVTRQSCPADTSRVKEIPVQL